MSYTWFSTSKWFELEIRVGSKIAALLILLLALLAPNRASGASRSAEATLHITVIVMPTIGSTQTITVQPNSVKADSIVYNLRPDENGAEQRASVQADLPAQSDANDNSSPHDKAPGGVLQEFTFVKR